MKNNFTINSRITFLGMLLFMSLNVFAQPANDACANATAMTLSADQASCVWVDGDTRMTEDAQAVTGTPGVCSGSWYRDDVWFTFSTGSTVPVNGIRIECEFGAQADDVPAVGMALYNSCDASEVALACFSSADAADNFLRIQALCLAADSDYVVRVWSGVSPDANSGTFRICAYEVSDPDVIDANVFWGDQQFEGDFDGGLNGWTTTSEAPCDTVDLWQWVPTGSTLEASVANNFGDASSAAVTACNGAVTFNSDGFDQTATCAATQIGELISPVIDLSAIVPAGTAGISVLFFQTTRQFQSTYIISYTNDGTTWFDIEINDEFIVNSATFNVYKRVFLPDADLTSANFQFKFRYEADYYYWIIDDVQIIETEAHNLQANNFYAIAPNLLTPASQTDSLRFLIDVENVGATAQTNVNANVTITNSGGTDVYSEDLSYGTIPANFLDENRIFPGHYLPPAVVDTYTGSYTITADSSDFDPSNNNQSFAFQITDSTFAKEEATNLFAGSPQTPPELTWTVATTYFVRNGALPTDPNIKYECSSVLFSLQDPAEDVGGFVNLYLYEWEDTNNDGISQNTERTVVGNSTYVIDGTETDEIVVLENFNTGDFSPIELKANTNYVLSAGLSPVGATKIEFSLTNDNDLNAIGFLTDSLTTIPRLGGLWNTTDGDGGLNSDLTQLGSTPRLRMHVNPYAEVSVNQPLDQSNKLNVYPNPASEVVNLELDLVEDLNNAIVRIIDLNARNVMEVTYDNLSNQTLTYSVANLAAGTYFVKIQSDEGFITKKFTIVK